MVIVKMIKLLTMVRPLLILVWVYNLTSISFYMAVCRSLWGGVLADELEHESLLRVWCRQSSTDSCHGLTFSQSAHIEDGGKLTQGPDTFTVEVLEPSHGEGIYWGGVLDKNDTIIKLAEGYLHSCKQKGTFKPYKELDQVIHQALMDCVYDV